jgi:hypothetical protein
MALVYTPERENKSNGHVVSPFGAGQTAMLTNATSTTSEAVCLGQRADVHVLNVTLPAPSHGSRSVGGKGTSTPALEDRALPLDSVATPEVTPRLLTASSETVAAGTQTHVSTSTLACGTLASQRDSRLHSSITRHQHQVRGPRMRFDAWKTTARHPPSTTTITLDRGVA